MLHGGAGGQWTLVCVRNAGCVLGEQRGVVLGQADRPLACSAALEKCNSNSWHLFPGGEGARAQWSLFPLSLEMGFYPAAELAQGGSSVLCPAPGLLEQKQGGSSVG